MQKKRVLIIDPKTRNGEGIIKEARFCFVMMWREIGGWVYDDDDLEELTLSDALDRDPEVFLWDDRGFWKEVRVFVRQEKANRRRFLVCFNPRALLLEGRVFEDRRIEEGINGTS